MSPRSGAAGPITVWSWKTRQRRSPSQATVFGALRAGGTKVEPVPVRAADAQPGVRAGHVVISAGRLEEGGEAAAPGGADSFGYPCRHGDEVAPLPRRGAEVTGLAAAVEQVKHLVGGR